MESVDIKNCDYRGFIKDIRSHPKKMGLSERSKTFTIENLLKSDRVKSGSALCPSAATPSALVVESMRLSFQPEALTCDLLNGLDLTRSAAHQGHPQLLNWLRLHGSPVAAAQHTHYLLGALPGN